MTRPNWLSLDFILEIHSDQIAEHGGTDGIRDEGLLDSAIARPLNAFAYGEDNLVVLSALYAAGIAKNHPFLDGNKRTAFVASEVFLDLNGIELFATDDEALAAMLSLASGEWDEREYASWLSEFTRPTG